MGYVKRSALGISRVFSAPVVVLLLTALSEEELASVGQGVCEGWGLHGSEKYM